MFPAYRSPTLNLSNLLLVMGKANKPQTQTEAVLQYTYNIVHF